jgi:hypothetical protein
MKQTVINVEILMLIHKIVHFYQTVTLIPM